MKSEQVNDEAEPVRIQWYHPGFILAFLNFHRRTILGLLLVAGVAYLLVRLNDPSPSDPDQLGDEAYLPAATATDSGSQPAVPLSSGQAEASVAVKPVAPERPPKPKTTDEKLNELLDTASDWSSLQTADAIEFLEKRLMSLREVLQAPDLKPRQRNYCELHFIDSVSLLTQLSGSTDAGIEGIEELMAEVERNFGESENLEVAASAKVAFVASLVTQYVAVSSEENFEAFSSALQERQAAIMASKRSKEQITRVIVEAVKLTGDDARLRKVALEHLSQVVDFQDAAVTDLAINLFFPRFDLENLPGRVRSEAPEADDDVQFLIEQLEKHPDMPLHVYSVLASSIARYQNNGEQGKADKCIEQLRGIAPTITAERIRKEVLKGIGILGSTDPTG